MYSAMSKKVPTGKKYEFLSMLNRENLLSISTSRVQYELDMILEYDDLISFKKFWDDKDLKPLININDVIASACRKNALKISEYICLGERSLTAFSPIFDISCGISDKVLRKKTLFCLTKCELLFYMKLENSSPDKFAYEGKIKSFVSFFRKRQGYSSDLIVEIEKAYQEAKDAILNDWQSYVKIMSEIVDSTNESQLSKEWVEAIQSHPIPTQFASMAILDPDRKELVLKQDTPSAVLTPSDIAVSASRGYEPGEIGEPDEVPDIARETAEAEKSKFRY